MRGGKDRTVACGGVGAWRRAAPGPGQRWLGPRGRRREGEERTPGARATPRPGRLEVQPRSGGWTGRTAGKAGVETEGQSSGMDTARVAGPPCSRNLHCLCLKPPSLPSGAAPSYSHGATPPYQEDGPEGILYPGCPQLRVKKGRLA